MPKPKPKAVDRTALIELIETALTTGLMHPGTGDGPIPLALPMFRNSTMPDEVARHFADDAGLPHANVAKLVAEALASLLESAGASGSATAVRQAAKNPPVTDPTPAPPPHPAGPTPGPRPFIPDGQPAGRMLVTLNGETLMQDLGDWKQHQPAQIAQALQNPVTAPAWAKALLAAIVDVVTTGRGQHVDITTTDDGGWTMRVSAA